MSGIPTNSADRLAKWDLKYDPARITAINTLTRPQQRQHAAEKFAALESMELRVKQVLNGLGVPTKDVGSYLSFGRTVWSTQQKHHGEDLSIEVQVQLNKWVARGLVQSALEKIRKDVFDISAPVTP